MGPGEEETFGSWLVFSPPSPPYSTRTPTHDPSTQTVVMRVRSRNPHQAHLSSAQHFLHFTRFLQHYLRLQSQQGRRCYTREQCPPLFVTTKAWVIGIHGPAGCSASQGFRSPNGMRTNSRAAFFQDPMRASPTTNLETHTMCTPCVHDWV